MIDLTLTGADSATSIEGMVALSAQYPEIEWGVLFHSEKHGSGRYPSVEWLHALTLYAGQHPGALNLSLHLCGETANRLFVAGTQFFGMRRRGLSFKKIFQRVQMNVNMQAGLFRADDIALALSRYPDIQIITQHNQSNQVLHMLVDNVNHQVLFDASGGRGNVPKEWQPPLFRKRCGYAGGLGLDNLKEELAKIKPLTISFDPWIDMESSLRVEDKFSLDICEQVAALVRQETADVVHLHEVIRAEKES